MLDDSGSELLCYTMKTAVTQSNPLLLVCTKEKMDKLPYDVMRYMILPAVAQTLLYELLDLWDSEKYSWVELGEGVYYRQKILVHPCALVDMTKDIQKAMQSPEESYVYFVQRGRWAQRKLQREILRLEVSHNNPTLFGLSQQKATRRLARDCIHLKKRIAVLVKLFKRNAEADLLCTEEQYGYDMQLPRPQRKILYYSTWREWQEDEEWDG
jgi:hypothetical protein